MMIMITADVFALPNETLEIKVAVDKEGDEDRVDNRYGSRLRRCEVTGEDSAENDERHQDSPDRFLEGVEHVSDRERFSLRVVELARLIEGDRNEDHTHQSTRDETVAEQGVDTVLRDNGV